MAGCFLTGPSSGSGFEPLRAPTEFPPRYPEIFHFPNHAVDYPSAGSTDPQGCGNVSLSAAGETVWYGQKEAGWFSSPTTLAEWATLSIPANEQVEATSPAGATVSYGAGASDAEGSVPTNCSPASGSVFGFGRTQVTCSATTQGGTVTGKFAVTVVDTTPPVISIPEHGVIAEATGPSGATVPFTATATDTVDGAVTASCTPHSGTTFALGSTRVSCSAVDSHGNSAEATFLVTVQDTTPPTISGMPNNTSVEATGPTGATVFYTSPTANDVVDGPVPATCKPTSGATYPVGMTTVTCSARDSHGNESKATFTVTVTRVPSVTKVAPNRGSADGLSTVTITGTKLANVTAVRFGVIAAASFNIKSDTQIVAITPPASPRVVDVSVSGPGGASALSTKDRYTYTPTITSVSPNTGPEAGGTTVTITGTGFAAGATLLKFGSTKALAINCVSSSECRARTPAQAAATVDVTAVVNKVSSPKSAADRFTYS